MDGSVSVWLSRSPIHWLLDAVIFVSLHFLFQPQILRGDIFQIFNVYFSKLILYRPQ